MQENEGMSLAEHLGELRTRIIWVIVVLVLSMIAGLFAAVPLLSYLKNVPPADEIAWNAFSPWDAISIYMKVAFVAALVIVLPFMMYQLWSFVKPGLRIEEQRATIKYIPGVALLFLLGLSFAYFIVFPMAFQFTLVVTKSLELTETYGIMQYFSFMFNILIPMAVLFELPAVVMFLTRLRILNPKRLAGMRRYAYLLLVITGTMVTPPDFISDLLVVIPLILLYELSVMLSRVIYRKQLAADQAREAEYGLNN